ncbi:MAG TPA: hypothetical protein VF193_17050, partial [Steroidobacter sp.]
SPLVIPGALDTNRLHPLATGMGFIVYQKRHAGALAVGHDGMQDGFTSALTLYPDSGTGVFVSLFSSLGVLDEWSLSAYIATVARASRHSLQRVLSETETRFAEAFLPPAQVASPAREPLADSDVSFLTGTYVNTPTHGPGAMFLTRVLSVAIVLDVFARGSSVWINGDGPYLHAGGGVLIGEDGEPKWLFGRTAEGLVLQEPDEPPFDMYVEAAWHEDARVTFLPFLLRALATIPAWIFGFMQRRSEPRRRVGYLIGYAGIAALLGIYFELEYFAAAYLANGITPALVAWRVLLISSWVAAVAALLLIAVRARELLGFGVRHRSHGACSLRCSASRRSSSSFFCLTGG